MMKTAIDKIKELGLYIVMPVVFIAGVIYYLITKNTSLKTEIKILNSGKEIEDAKDNAKTLEEEATRKADDFYKLSDEYFKNRDKK